MPKHHQESSCSVDSSESKHNHCKKEFEHKIQLQLSDSLGFPVAGTQFWVTLTIVKEGPKVTIQLPVINFETGPIALQNPFYPSGQFAPGFPPPGGYLYTADGFLPKDIRPNDVIPPSIVAASNNGMSEAFSFTQNPSTLPVPPSGYIVQVTNAGALQVQCAGTFGNIIPVGPQILLPCSITYIVKPTEKLCKNIKISTGFTNTTQFPGPWQSFTLAGNGLRDTHPNDAYDNVVAWAWVDNSMVVDKTNGTLNCMVAVGKVGKNGKLKVGSPVQLTNFPPGVEAWDTAVAINRSDPKNIIVSYGIQTLENSTAATICRAVSFDGGKTWPAPYDNVTPQLYNGPLSYQPPLGASDVRGVTSDKYGNIWYCTEFNDPITGIGPPIFYVSTNKGVDFTLLDISALTPPAPITAVYDFPQICFGGDGQGNYGLYSACTIWSDINYDAYPTILFIPITGAGLDNINIAGGTFSSLQALINSNYAANITASIDGRVWMQGFVGSQLTPYTTITPISIVFKSPGPIDQNYAGPFQTVMVNNAQWYFADDGYSTQAFSTQSSQPIWGYWTSAQSVIYDDKRQALYAITAAQNPDQSENMRIYFVISRDNGQTWSAPIDINSTDFANRGFQSMSLDTVTGNLVFGWYDGRNDPTYQSIEYFGTVIPAKTLDKLVDKIPLSNPLYSLPSAAGIAQPSSVKVKPNKTVKRCLKKIA